MHAVPPPAALPRSSWPPLPPVRSEIGRDPGDDAPAPPGAHTVVIGRTSGTVVVTVKGVLDGDGADRLHAILHDLVDGQGNQSVAVNLSEADVVHDSVATVLTVFWERAVARGGRLAVHDPPPSVSEQLRRAGLQNAFETPAAPDAGR